MSLYWNYCLMYVDIMFLYIGWKQTWRIMVATREENKEFCIPDYIFLPDSGVEDHAVEPTYPVLVFVNSRSGGQLGGDLIKTYRQLLNRLQVPN